MAQTSPQHNDSAASYDVFINHRGPDVKKTFASHLYKLLTSFGLRVFLDKPELGKGFTFPLQIEAAIQSAAIHIAVFSPTYANSPWCLNELVSMIRTGATILPVFYKVDPWELRLMRTNGMYAEALQRHLEKGRYDFQTIMEWKEALSTAANISGFELERFNGDEGELLEEVVMQVWNHDKIKQFLDDMSIPLWRAIQGVKDKEIVKTILSRVRSQELSLEKIFEEFQNHKVYMEIKEQMVKLLNEDSWDDVVRNYPKSNSTSTLKAFYLAFKKMRKDDNGAQDSFKTFIEKIKIETLRKQRIKNVELDPTLNHFIWNGSDTIQYQVIQGDCEDIAKLIPKRDYALVIADIPHGFNIPNIYYDSDPYTYQAFSKVVAGFVEVTSSPLWRFVTFHSDTQLAMTLSSFKGKTNSRMPLTWQKSNLHHNEDQQFINDCEFIHIDSWAKNDNYISMIFNRVDGKSHSQTLTYDAVVRKLTYEDKEAEGEIVNIYQKPQLLINYLIDICSNEGDWVLDLFSGSGTTLACCLQKGRNCIAIEKDPLQCNFIQQRINALQFLPDAMQEIGLKKGDFSESRVAKKAKEPQPPLHGMFGKTYIGRFADIKDPLEEENEQKEAKNIVQEDNDETLENEEFALRDIVD